LQALSPVSSLMHARQATQGPKHDPQEKQNMFYIDASNAKSGQWRRWDLSRACVIALRALRKTLRCLRKVGNRALHHGMKTLCRFSALM